jgi:hypothetical protein
MMLERDFGLGPAASETYIDEETPPVYECADLSVV